MQAKRNPQGIRVRHSRTCASVMSGRRCNCQPSYEASVFSAKDGRKIRKSFSTQAAAKMWRADATGAVRRGTMKAPTATTLREAWDAWLAGARDGSIRNRSGDEYKPSVLRSYETSMRLRVLDDLGSVRLSDVRRAKLSRTLRPDPAKGFDPSTVRNALMPLRALYRRSVGRGEITVNATAGVEACRSSRHP